MIQIYGASGHAKVVIEIAEANNISIQKIVDGNANISNLLEYEVTRPETIENNLATVIAIGNNTVRHKIATTLNQFKFITLIHPNTYISKRSTINIGTVIMAGVSINSCVQIGKHCIINTNASIDHDCIINDYVHISPNVALAGNVTIGALTHIGIGASVIQGVTIGSNVQIGAGAVIIRDVPDNAVVVGNPGKIIKYQN